MSNAGEPMTNKEAIKILKNLMTMKNISFIHFSQRLAVGMAINALEKQMEQKKKGKKFIEIVTEYPSMYSSPEYEGKPYFSIRYEENGEIFEGFGTYKPEVLAEYMYEYFMEEE